MIFFPNMKKNIILFFYSIACFIVLICFCNISFAQNRYYWDTIPVFDGGRTMPLSSFASQIVFEICGTTHPLIIQDNTMIAELDNIVETQKILQNTTPAAKTESESKSESESESESYNVAPTSLVPDIKSMDPGLGAVANFLRNAKHNSQTDRIERVPYITMNQAAAISSRIRTLIPLQGRYFQPSELLMSWMIEPEIWEFIPIISLPETDYRQLQGFPVTNSAGRTLTHISIFQLKNSANFKQRQIELAQKQQNPTNRELSTTDKITERILVAIYAYENLTFDPRKNSPDKMLEILQNAAPKSLHIAQQAWNELQNIETNPETINKTNEPQNTTHPTSTRWNEIYVALNQLTENFAANNNSENYKIPNLKVVELKFEKILNLIDENISESNSLMQKIYQQAQNPNNAAVDSSFTKFILPKLFEPAILAQNKDAIRQYILAYNYSLKSLRREVEAAYIALYDNGRTLRVMPIISTQTLSDVDTDYAVNPWASMRLVLNGGEHAIRRFIDPTFKLTKTQPKINQPEREKLNSENTTPETPITEPNKTLEMPSIADSLSIIPRNTNKEIKKTDAENIDDTATEPNAANNIHNNNDDATNIKTPENKNIDATENNPENESDIFRNADTNIYARPSFGSDNGGVGIFSEPVTALRINFLDSLYAIFVTPTRIDATAQFQQACQSLQHAIRECALRVEVQRQQLITNDEDLSAEMLEKTRYPLDNNIGMEHFYFSISPFFWMMILAKCSIIFGLVAIVAAFFWREITATVNTPVVKKISEEESAIETGKASVAEMSGIKSGVHSGVKSGIKSGVRSGIRSEIKTAESKSKIIAADNAANNKDKNNNDSIVANDIMQSIVAPGFFSGVNSEFGNDDNGGGNEQTTSEKLTTSGNSIWEDDTADYTNSTEEVMLWVGVGFLSVSIIVALVGGVMRALISGWAPVTNMYETVILMAVSAAFLGVWYTLYPLVQPAFSLAWRCTEFPNFSQISATFNSNRNNIAEGGIYAGGNLTGNSNGISTDGNWMEAKLEKEKRSMTTRQLLATPPRIILMIITFFVLMWISYGGETGSANLFGKFSQSVLMLDMIDFIVVLASIGAIVWFLPRIILSLAIFLPLLFNSNLVAASLGIYSYSATPAVASNNRGSSMTAVFSGENASGVEAALDNSGAVWFKSARNKILDRKLFLIAAAAIVFLAGFFAYGNTAQLNPNFKPLTAVLRSNFWLTVHVIAIIVSYAGAFIAWSMSVIALGAVIFGRYEIRSLRGYRELRFPVMFEMFVPSISRLIRFALLLLAVGTILGARWADYSWGRFWGWDPKEVWALITILFFAIVLHGRLAKYYGKIGVVVGALFSSIAVIMTWYGINFVFKGSVHSYGGGAANAATLFLIIFIAVNLLWGIAAIVRYKSELNR
jgi:ABC-type transport system involved in cytochrome c biogenesis permease subunit